MATIHLLPYQCNPEKPGPIVPPRSHRLAFVNSAIWVGRKRGNQRCATDHMLRLIGKAVGRCPDGVKATVGLIIDDPETPAALAAALKESYYPRVAALRN